MQIAAPEFNFYPRSPCGERHFKLALFASSIQFLSTLSLRRATSDRLPNIPSGCISIHALLAESDPVILNRLPQALKFLSTLSLRRATATTALNKATELISIHALLAESDNYVSKFTLNNQISIHALLAESDSSAHLDSWKKM